MKRDCPIYYHLWDVHYVSVFSSSGAGQNYSNPPEKKWTYVLTGSDTIDDVKSQLLRTDKDNLKSLLSATYLGVVTRMEIQEVAVAELHELIPPENPQPAPSTELHDDEVPF